MRGLESQSIRTRWRVSKNPFEMKCCRHSRVSKLVTTLVSQRGMTQGSHQVETVRVEEAYSVPWETREGPDGTRQILSGYHISSVCVSHAHYCTVCAKSRAVDLADVPGFAGVGKETRPPSRRRFHAAPGA